MLKIASTFISSVRDALVSFSSAESLLSDAHARSASPPAAIPFSEQLAKINCAAS